MWSIGGPGWIDQYGLPLAAWGATALMSVWAVGRRVRVAVLLVRDADRGEAVLVYLPDDHARGEVHNAVVLAESQRIWNVDGRPAEWRSERR